MIRHQLKIIFNQRRQNAWIIIELAVAFFILWYVVDFFYAIYQLKSKPMGLDYRQVYSVEFVPRLKLNVDSLQRKDFDYSLLKNLLEKYPDIEVVASNTLQSPLTGARTSEGYDSLRTIEVSSINPELIRVFRIKAENGTMESLLANPLVDVSDVYVTAYTRDSILSHPPTYERHKKMIVKGVIDHYRPLAYDKEASIIFSSYTQSDNDRQSDYIVRIRDGVTSDEFVPAFIEWINRELAQEFQVNITSYEDMHYNRLYDRGYITAEWGYKMAAIFILVCVFLGVIGTFIFRLEERRSESGIRMAMGASKAMLLRFYLTEGILLITLSALFCTILCLQVTMVEGVSKYADITIERFVFGIFTTYLLLLGVVSIATIIPSFRALREELTNLINES